METLANSPLAIAGIAIGGFVALLALGSAIRCCRGRYSLKNKVVVITGGSSGIGKAIAKICLQRGAHVALIARTVKTLEAAKAELEALGHGGRVSVHSADVGDDQAAARAMQEVAVAHGFIDCVITSAGVSKPHRFEETDAAEFASVLATNVTGTRNAVFHALPHMTRSTGGRIVFISSQAGQAAVYGYTAYAASKFALNGLAGALAMELHTRKIKVSVCFPPDTDTPLLAEENKTKPLITKLLSEATQTVSADVVASSVVGGMEVHTPLIGVGFDGWMLATLTSGMTPQPSPFMLLVEVLTLGLWRVVGLAYVSYFYYVIGRKDDEATRSGGAGTAAGAAPAPRSSRATEKAVLSERKNN